MDKKGIFDNSDLKFVALHVGLAALIGVVVLVVLLFWLKAYTQHGREVEVYDVTGMHIDEAEPLLAQQGLKMEVVDSTYSDKVPFGTIVDQNPLAHSHAKEGRLVYVTINATTKRQVMLPNLQDVSYRQAEATLRGLGLVVDETYDYEPSAFRDLVLDVKAGGRSVAPGDKLPIGTRVRLGVGFGRGTDMVEVPSVIGMDLQSARSALLSRRLTVGSVVYDEEAEAGIKQFVYHQTPRAGEQLLEGETVALRLSKDIDKTVTNSSLENEEDDSWF